MKLIACMVIAFVVHAIIAIFFYSNYGPVVGPDADAGAIGWTPMFFLDFPLIWVLEEWVSNNSIFMVALFVLGGVQWSLVVFLVARLASYVLTE